MKVRVRAVAVGPGNVPVPVAHLLEELQLVRVDVACRAIQCDVIMRVGKLLNMRNFVYNTGAVLAFKYTPDHRRPARTMPRLGGSAPPRFVAAEPGRDEAVVGLALVGRLDTPALLASSAAAAAPVGSLKAL